MSVQPELQPSEEEEEDENTIVIPIDRSFSDGDPAIWPKEARFERPDDTNYREKLAVMWLKHMGAYEEGTSFFFFFFLPAVVVFYSLKDKRRMTDNNPGINYILDSLPAGYSLFDRPRGTNPDIVSDASCFLPSWSICLCLYADSPVALRSA